MALLLGFVLIAGLGIAHHYGLLAVRAMKPNRPQLAIVAAFVGLLGKRLADPLLPALFVP